MVMGARSVDFKEALKWLCEAFRPDLLPEINKREYAASPEVKQYYERAALYEMLYQHGKELLFLEQGKDALAYLTGHRKYCLDILKKTEWFYLLPDRAARDYLRAQGVQDAAIEALHLQGYYGDAFRLAMPYRDRTGAITGFVKRAIEPDGIEIERDGKKALQRFDSSKGTEKHDIFNLRKCKGADTVLIVEGLADAMLLTALGIPAVALGQAAISQTHIEGLLQYKVKRVILSFDNDAGKPKHDTTLKALEIFGKTREIKGYVIDPETLTPHKDIDEVYRAEGIERVKALIADPLTGAEYTARRILAKHDTSNSLEYDKAKEELLTYADSDYLDFAEARRVIDITTAALDLPPDVVEAEIAAINSKRKREKEQDIYAQLARDLSKADGTAKARELIEEARQDAAQLTAADNFPPPFDADSLTAFLQEKKDRGAGYKTGYPSLDRMVRIRPGAITLIGGRPGHGKTTFMLNLLVNMLRSEEYKAKTFFFFTYEEPAGDLTVKIINLLAGKVIDEDRNTDAIEDYFQTNGTKYHELNTAREEFNQYVKNSRLYIVNKAYSAEDLTAHITALSGKYDLGAIFLDYIQKIRPGKAGDHYSRQTEVQYVSNLILNDGAIRNNVPIVAGAQLNRTADVEEALSLEQFREAGDLEQDANTALFVWNRKKEYEQLNRISEDPSATEGSKKRAIKKLESMKDSFNAGNIPFGIHIMKNRGAGGEGVCKDMTFNGPTLKITEDSCRGM
jgi:replicative DNA helicase